MVETRDPDWRPKAESGTRKRENGGKRNEIMKILKPRSGTRA